MQREEDETPRAPYNRPTDDRQVILRDLMYFVNLFMYKKTVHQKCLALQMLLVTISSGTSGI
jgi:hypothetical protein